MNLRVLLKKFLKVLLVLVFLVILYYLYYFFSLAMCGGGNILNPNSDDWKWGENRYCCGFKIGNFCTTGETVINIDPVVE